ncbi:hypothetical protein RND81_03G208200 [Saponaria officinalis]|uniref:Uncharacterized protein n=1 Tax=Saponaria officinalis TaxID=3572 RepID=A0AAW1MA92_SAPOF
MSYYYAFMLFMITANLLPHNTHAQDCNPSGTLTGTQAPTDQCDPSGSDCCVAGQDYETYTCSPQVTSQTSAILTLNSFESGGDGGGASKCDGRFHSDDTPVVALSTGWYDGGSRCGKQIVISANGMSVAATVVDECDSTIGCDKEHGYQPPCRNNIVDGSKAVWESLGISSDNPQYGEIDITWSDN